MLIKKPEDLRYSDVTHKSVYLNRRQLLAGIPAAVLAGRELLSPSRGLAGTKLPNLAKSPLSTDERQNTFDQVLAHRHLRAIRGCCCVDAQSGSCWLGLCHPPADKS